jgi:tRNA nucleotidyltransferase (CCA-adding enzyme)
VRELDSRSPTAILTTWLLVEDQQVRANLEQYMLTWREVQPLTNGHDLRARGLKPGPCYSRILAQLRSARLDAVITTPEQEMHLLEKLIEEEIDCHDGA